MTLNFQTEAAIRELCKELPEALRELAKASARREPIIIMVPNNTSPAQLQEFAKILKEALSG